MKTCPYCQVENDDAAQRCRFCDRDLNTAPSLSQPWEAAPDPTQPVRTARPDAGQAPAGAANTAARTYPPQAPAPPAYPPRSPRTDPSTNAGYSGQTRATYPSAPPGQPPSYGSGGGLPPTNTGYAQDYSERPKPRGARSDRIWYWLLGALAVLLLCMGGVFVWILTAGTAGGLGRAGSDLSTQVAGLFGGEQASATPLPSATMLAPSPWPTFTEQPSATPVPTLAPLPTDLPTLEASPLPAATEPPSSLEKYLSPECAAAFNQLEQLSKDVTQQPSLPLDAAWRDSLSQAVADVRAQCGSLDKASPVPGAMAEAQKNIDLATQSFDEANRLFKEGVDTFSPGKIFEAGKKLVEATQYLNQARKDLRDIGS